MKKKIENIGTLDARKVTKDLASRISSISNVGTLIMNDQSEDFLSEVSRSNIGSVIKTEDDIELVVVNSNMTIDKDFFEAIKGKLILCINGKVEIKKDVTPNMIKDVLLQGLVNGKVIAVDSIASVIKTSMQLNGKILAYNKDYTYLDSDCVLNDDFFVTYFGDRQVAVSKMVATEDMDLNDFVEAFDKIQILSQLIISRSNMKKLKAYLAVDQNMIKLIPDNTCYFDEKCQLDSVILERAAGRNIYVNGSLDIKDVDLINQLDGKLQADKITCRKQDYETIKASCMNQNQVFAFYEDRKLENFTTANLNKTFLLSFHDHKKYENFGDLIFDKDIIGMDFDKVNLKIHNFGNIQAPKDCLNDVQKLVVENFGSVTAIGQTVEIEKDDDVLYSNMGRLNL